MTERLEEILDLPADPPQIELGTVGWADRDDWFEKGSTDDDGHDLVFVTLYRGRDPSRRPTKGVAAGYRIRCTLADHVGVPPKGARVYVAIPQGMETTPGAGCIIGSCTPGLGRFDNLASNARTLSAPDGPARFTVRDDGTIIVRTTHNGENVGYDIYCRWATDSWKFVAPWGMMRSDASGWSWVGAGGASMNLGAIGGLPSPLDAITSYWRLQAGLVQVQCSVASFGSGAVGAPTPEKLAKSATVAAALAAIQTALGSLNTAIAAGLVATGGLTSPAAGTAYTAAVAPIMSTLATALTAAATAMQAIVVSE